MFVNPLKKKTAIEDLYNLHASELHHRAIRRGIMIDILSKFFTQEEIAEEFGLRQRQIRRILVVFRQKKTQ